jgi:hypothetical protein
LVQRISVLKQKPFFGLILLLFSTPIILAQQNDSLHLYSRIKKIAAKRKFTKLIFSSIFSNPAISGEKKEITDNIIKHEGCIIRKIKISVYDPYPSKDTIIQERGLRFFQRTINRFHFSTKKWVIQNKLLFNAGKPLLALEITESERALRQTAYVNDASIIVESITDSDSVDVLVEVNDKWAVTLPVEIKTTEKAYFALRNKNLLGLGQYFEQTIDIDLNGKNIFFSRYNIDNLRNSYISTNIYYRNDAGYSTAGLEFIRPSFSTLIKWSGGLLAEKNIGMKEFELNETQKKYFPLEYTYYDTWVVRRFPIKNSNELIGNTGISLGSRVFARDFQLRPQDVNKINSDIYFKSGYLSVINYYNQRFYKEKYIYRFGSFEDVPCGMILQFTNGIIKQEYQQSKNYLSIFFRTASNFNFGYLSCSVLLATYYAKNFTNEVFFRNTIYFFSKLIALKTWSMRQFLHFDFSQDLNKNLSKKILLRPSDLYSFPFDNYSVNAKSTLNFETVMYTPYQWIGFKFAPVLMLGSAVFQYQTEANSSRSKVFHALALGILFRNENLINSTFQISVGYYPVQDEGKNQKFVIGSVASFTLRVNGFSVFKPEFVDY